MKYVITGGAGFIGSHLADYFFKKKKKFIILDNLSNGKISNIHKYKKNFIKCDLSKKGKWQNKISKNDVIIHLAALADIVPSIVNPEDYFNSNVVGTFNLLETARKVGAKKIIYAASSSCYGLTKKFPTNEKTKLSLEYPYALTKYLGEELAMHWAKVFKINVISLRLFNVYGERSRTNGTYGAVFGVFLAQKINNKPLSVVGDGKQKRDFIYVKDVVNAIILSIKSKTKNQVFNIGSGKPKSINTLANYISKKQIHIEKRPGEPDLTYANISKAKKLLNWRPVINFENGVKKVLKNISYWKDSPVWTEKKIKNATKEWFKFLK